MNKQEYVEYVSSLKDKFNLGMYRPLTRNGETNLWEGGSGNKHQIDISYHSPDLSHLVLIHCELGNLITPPLVLIFLEKVRDIRENYPDAKVQAIMVSDIGYMGIDLSSNVEGFEPEKLLYKPKISEPNSRSTLSLEMPDVKIYVINQ